MTLKYIVCFLVTCLGITICGVASLATQYFYWTYRQDWLEPLENQAGGNILVILLVVMIDMTIFLWAFVICCKILEGSSTSPDESEQTA